MGYLKWCFLFSFLAVVLSADLEFSDPQVKIDQNKLIEYLNSNQELFESLKAYSTASRKKQTAIVNEFADKLIANINEAAVQLGVDPIDIPGFEQEFFVFWIRGKIVVDDGELTGISSIERRGNIVIEYEFPKLTLKLICGLEKLRFEYHYEAKWAGLGPTGQVLGSSDGSKFTADVALDLSNLRLEKVAVRVDNIGKTKIRFTGLPGNLINILTQLLIPIVRPIIKNTLNSVLELAMSLVVRLYNSWICGVLADCPAELLNGMF